MATHSSVLAWRIPGTEEPCGLPSMGSHRVGHDWSDLAAAAVTQVTWASQGALRVKNLPAKEGDAGSIPGSGRSPGGGKWQPSPVFLSGKFLGWRSLAVYSPAVAKESDTTEQLSTRSHLSRSTPQVFLSLKYRSEGTSNVHRTPYRSI